MKPEFTWISGISPGRLATMGHPRGGEWLEDEVRDLRQAGVQVVVSALTRPEVERLGLQRERVLCTKAGVEFLSFPIPDHGEPASIRRTRHFVRKIVDRLKKDRAIVVHCFAGIGRSSILAACAMSVSGTPLQLAWERIGAARRLPVPDTKEQRRWVEKFVSRRTATARFDLRGT